MPDTDANNDANRQARSDSPNSCTPPVLECIVEDGRLRPVHGGKPPQDGTRVLVVVMAPRYIEM